MIKKLLKYLFTRNNVLCYDKNDSRIEGSVIMGEEEKSKKTLTVFDVANFFRSKESMTHKKLQKLVYYAYAWYIALYNDTVENITNKLCVDTVFEAWVHGPVCRKLYDVYSNNYGQVDKYKNELNELIVGDLKKFLEEIYKVFGKYSGDELEMMSHNEYPWQNARNTLSRSEPSNNIISEVDMFVYYNNLND